MFLSGSGFMDLSHLGPIKTSMFLKVSMSQLYKPYEYLSSYIVMAQVGDLAASVEE